MSIRNIISIIFILLFFQVSCSKNNNEIFMTNLIIIDDTRYFILGSFFENEGGVAVIVIDKSDFQFRDVNLSGLYISKDKGKTKQLVKKSLAIKDNPVIELKFWDGMYVVKNGKVYYHAGVITREAVENLRFGIPSKTGHQISEDDILNDIYLFFNVSKTPELYYDWTNPDNEVNHLKKYTIP